MPDEKETLQTVQGNPDGTVILRVGDDEYVLKIPTFKQYRDAVLASDKALKPGKPVPITEQSLTDPVVHSYLQWAPARFSFWRSIVTALGDKPFPKSDDDLPLWLASADPINELMGCWLTNPQAAPGG